MTFKRFWIVGLILLMILQSMLVFATPSSWAEQAVLWLEYDGLLPGALFSVGTEQKDITREQFCELAVRLYARAKGVSVDQLGAQSPFKDTQSLMVARAYHLGIVKGLTTDTFGPQNKITREQLATMLYRELKLLGISSQYSKGTVFTDNGSISAYAVDAVYFCRANDLVKGVGDNRFAPKNNTTVEQAQLIVYNILKQYEWSKPVMVAVSKTFGKFKIPSTTSLSISSDSKTGIDLRLVLPVTAATGVLDVPKQHFEVFSILRSHPSVTYPLAKAALMQLKNSWDSSRQQYVLVDPLYLTKEGGVSNTKPTQLPYIRIEASGTMTLDLDLP